MYKKILLPVDMGHLEKLDKSLTVAADLANHYSATVVYVGVTTEQPSSVAHTPAEFQTKLEAFAAAQSQERGHTTAARSYASHDPSVDLNKTLLQAVEEVGADLVVMAAYVPTLASHLRRSHEAVMAAHSHVSVFIVR